MKRFDDIFREKVERAFSNFNADNLADEGWNSFLARKREEKRPYAFLILPLWARVASLALVIGVGTLFTYLYFNNGNVPETVLQSSDKGNINETPSPLKSVVAMPATGKTAVKTRPLMVNDTISKPGDLPERRILEKPDVNEMDRFVLTPVKTGMISLPVFAEDMIERSNDSIKEVDLNKSGNTILEELLPVSTGTVKHSRGFEFLTGMSGMMAYVNDAANATPGVSAGVYLEHRISGRFSFRPGLAIGMSSLGIDYSQGNSAFAAAATVINGTYGAPVSFDGQLSMVTMEIPLNIVFKLLERKSSSVYLSAGTSSIFYISEHFTGDFVNEYTQDKYNETSGTTYSETRYSTVSLDNTYGAFSRMDYFGLATLSAGYSLPLGNSSAMQIEPFMQFPLNDLTSLDLRVYYTGISMKLKFGRKNK